MGMGAAATRGKRTDSMIRDETHEGDSELLEGELPVPVRIAVFVEVRQTPFGQS